MRVLLLSPFAPNLRHDHAAADTIVQLVPRLADRVELHVYSPQNHAGAMALGQPDPGYALVPATVAAPAGALARLGVKPGWLRQAWPHQANRDVAEAVHRIRPDVIHAEYLQSAEVVRRWPNAVLGLHDVTESVMRQSLRSASLPGKPYRLAELVRTRWFERAAIRGAAAVLTLSEADFAVASRLNRNVVLARPGVELGDREWAPRRPGSTPRLVFAGAMWRRANVLIAHFLVREVMPLVWRDFPSTELRIVGARPPADVVGLASADSRVVVTGEVPDLRDEMLDSDAVLAPSIVGGGVLMKVAHAMALGCPVVTSPGPAASVDGDETSLFVGTDGESLAGAVRHVLSAPDEAARRGRNARSHIGRLFQWDNTVDAYLSAYSMARRS